MRFSNRAIFTAFAVLAAAAAVSLAILPPGPDTPVSAQKTEPAFRDIDAWINSPPLDLDALHGKVVLVDFWTYSCINCLNTLPYLKAWHQKYKDQGLVVVGVHTPEFGYEKSNANVKAAVEKLQIPYAVAQDNQYATWKAFDNHYWPALYLIDQQGHVVYSHFGEGRYAQTEDRIRQLLAPSRAADS
ncbi:thioredoxin family protein [Variovorax sp. OV329]|uniref:thioredoxin family protein n=1 Tax=Variovorax sp. OV329 TaxID=1882825 RepID=UPI0008F1510F|nr:thioredoxin family protein [Variovorax sp. OV329]SFN03118.1 Thiol-disulfide isomerase or thioredoxin [Variovorax sp. OV329]